MDSKDEKIVGMDAAVLQADTASAEEPQVVSKEERTLLWKQDSRIITICAGIYFLCFLDRANIGNAKILNSSTHDDMQTATNLSDHDFAVGLMIFCLAYTLFEVPSNILLKKLRPSRWLAFLMFGWGVVSMTTAAVRNAPSIIAIRFLLGMFEAGLFPGLIYYLTFWYRHNERSVRVAFILASATLAGAFGGAIAYGIGHMNGVGGLAGWRWLFILEGIPSCLAAILVFFFLPDFPETSKWLSDSEREMAKQRLLNEGSKGDAPSLTWADAKATLTDWRLYGHYLIYFCLSPAFASLGFFAPSIVAGLDFKDLTAQLMTVPPWGVAYVCQVLVAISADHFNERGLHAAICSFVGAIGFALSGASAPTAYHARYAGLILATAGSFSAIPPLLGWLTSNVVTTASIGLAIAINVSFGAGVGQMPGNWIYKGDEKTRGYPTGHWTNFAFTLLVATGSLLLRVYYVAQNRKIASAAKEQGVKPRLYKL